MAEQTAGSFTQSPAVTQFSVLYGQVQSYVMSPSDTSAATLAKRWINDAIRKLNQRNWSWSLAAATITFTAGEGGREYALQTNYKAPRSFELLDSSSRIVGNLAYRPPRTFDEEFPDRASTDPSAYTVFNVLDNGYLTLSGPPSSGWVTAYPTGRLRYYKRIALLSGDTDLIVAPTEVEPFVLWRACADAAAFFVPSKVAYADQRANEEWRALVKADVKNELTDWD